MMLFTGGEGEKQRGLRDKTAAEGPGDRVGSDREAQSTHQKAGKAVGAIRTDGRLFCAIGIAT